MNEQYLKHVGYKDTNECIATYFSKPTIDLVSRIVSNRLKPLYPQGVIVPCHIISGVLNDIYTSYDPPVGDIFTRYNVPNNNTNMFQSMVDQAIQVIYDDVVNNLTMAQTNDRLSIWDSVLGDFNEKGLRSFAPIKVQEKRPQPFQFNMNY
jgi:hypothetical protein